MFVDGVQLKNELADELGRQVAQMPPVRLRVFMVGRNRASESFIRAKSKFGEEIGVTVEVINLPEDIDEGELVELVRVANADIDVSGIVVQLPLPPRMGVNKILDEISAGKDPDLLGAESRARFAAGESEILPPVVASIEYIFLRFGVDIGTLEMALVGLGRLVGEPVGKWLQNQGIDFALVTEENESPERILAQADIIISGAGVPGLIKPSMIKDGVVLIDAGTSEAPSQNSGNAGGLVGDCEPGCAEKASLMTPVPGGLGPLTVAMLFRNLLLLSGETAK